MQLAHGVRVVEHHLGHERARLDVAAPLQLEDVALGAEHRPGRQPVHDRRAHAPLQLTHEATPSETPPNLADVNRPMSYTVPRCSASWASTLPTQGANL